jgi:hypothetical protein
MPGAYQAPRPAGGQVQDQIGAFGGNQLEDLRGAASGGLQGLLAALRGQTGGVDPNRGYAGNDPLFGKVLGGGNLGGAYDRGVIENPAYPGGTSAGWSTGGELIGGPVRTGDGGFMEPRYGPPGGPGLPYATFDAGGRSPQTLQKQWGALDPDAQQNYIRQYSAATPKMQASVRDAFYGPGGQPGLGGGVADRPMLLQQGGMGPAATAALARGAPEIAQNLRGALGSGYQTQAADLGGGGGLSTGLTRNPNPMPRMPGPAAGTAVAGGVGGGAGGAGAAGAPTMGGGGLQGLRSLAARRAGGARPVQL